MTRTSTSAPPSSHAVDAWVAGLQQLGAHTHPFSTGGGPPAALSDGGNGSFSSSGAGAGRNAHAEEDFAELVRAACGLPPVREELTDEDRERVVRGALEGGEEALLRRVRFRCGAELLLFFFVWGGGTGERGGREKPNRSCSRASIVVHAPHPPPLAPSLAPPFLSSTASTAPASASLPSASPPAA